MRQLRWTCAISVLAFLIPGAREVWGFRPGSQLSEPLIRAGNDQDIIGRATFRSIAGRSRFHVRIQKGPVNQPLDLVVGGVARATVTTDANGNASLDFRAGTSSSSQPALDFDPRGETIEIADATNTLLTNVTGAGDDPPGSRVDERVRLQATGAIAGASGHARLRERGGRRHFTVEIEDVPDGSYDLLVDGTLRATIVVTAGEGEVEFATGSDDPDELPLDFDPLGALLQVAQGSTIILTGTFLAPAPGVSVCTPSESDIDLTNVGPAFNASGDVRLRRRDDCRVQFRVEVEDLPVGVYDVAVGGTVRGTITVATQLDGRVEGEIEFSSDPDEVDELSLTFDPTGATVEVVQGTTVFLSTTLGSTPPGGTCDPQDTEVALVNPGADGDAKGRVRFRQEDNCDTDLRVEIEKLAPGSYDLFVGGTVRGTIVVLGGSDAGELEFDNEPDDPGEVLLDFDPRGQLVEVRQGATVYLSVEVPN